MTINKTLYEEVAWISLAYFHLQKKKATKNKTKTKTKDKLDMSWALVITHV